MKKLIPIFIFSLCIFLASNTNASIDVADIAQSIGEKVQTVTESAIEVQKKAEQASSYKAEFDEKIKTKPNFLKVPDVSLKIPKDFTNINKLSTTEKEINDKFLLQDNRVQDYTEQNRRIESEKRETWAEGYSVFFTTRVSVSNEKPVKEERKDTQDIIAQTNAKLLSIAQREAQILKMEGYKDKLSNIDAALKHTATIEGDI